MAKGKRQDVMQNVLNCVYPNRESSTDVPMNYKDIAILASASCNPSTWEVLSVHSRV